MKFTKPVLFAAALGALCFTSNAPAQVRQPANPAAPPASNAPPAAAAPAIAGEAYFKASDLIGMTVKGAGNSELGEVEDLFIDARTRQIEYLVLDTGVFADLGGKQPVLPWALVEPHFVGDADSHFLMTGLTSERLKTAPAIDTSDVELGRSAAWISLVNRFYAEDLKHRNVSRPDLDANQQPRDPSEARPGVQPRPGTPRQPAPGQKPDADATPRTPN